MSRELLSTWLNVPAAPWPPDHYALLGLGRGQGSTEEVEQRVLERMEKLRHYQLLHPEPVTEGMNLLAQAMVCLTDPKSRTDYDRKLGLAPRKEAPPPPPPPEEEEQEEEVPELPLVEAPPPPPRRPRPPEPTVYSLDEEPATEAVPDAILIPEFVEEPLPLPPEEEEEAEDEDFAEVAKDFRRRDEREVEEEEEEQEERPREDERDYRRGLYAELVRLRRVLRLWEQIRSYLDDPEKTFARRTDTIAFIARLTELRPLLDSVSDYVGGSGQPGSLLAMMSKQPQLGVDTFRSLLPSQRDALAKDCRSAHYVLEDEYQRLRKYLRSLNVKGFKRRVWRPFLRQLIARPEWLLLLFGVVALVVAFVRSVPP